MKLRKKSSKVTSPEHAQAQPELGQVPTTVAAPISGEIVVTANNRPGDAGNWQNEPGPGFGQRAEDEVAHRDSDAMERVKKVDIPAT
jgi:hypothetical protein